MNILSSSSFSSNRFVRNFVRDRKLILTVFGIIFFFSLINLFCIYKPKYKSSARIWIKNADSYPFVVNSDYENSSAPLTLASNPLLTQMEVLKSKTLRKKMAKLIAEKYPDEAGNEKALIARFAGSYKVKNKTNTDILSINLKWDNPEKARDILTLFIDEYKIKNIEMEKSLKSYRKEFIDNQIVEIKDKLANVRSQIKDYQLAHNAVNIREETDELTRQKISLHAKVQDVEARISSTNSKIESIKKKLNLTTDEAIKAVALGTGNDVLITLRSELNKVIQDYSHDGIKYSKTNPKMVALKNRIDTIKEQISNQVKLTLGQASEGDSNSLSIMDPVRERLVEDLVLSHTDLKAFKTEKESFEDSIKNINFKESKIPAKLYNLTKLEQEETNLSQAFDELRIKQIEAKLKEAESVTGFALIDVPSLPKSAAFPNPFHMFILSIMAALSAGIMASVAKTVSQDLCEGTANIEKTTGKPVLGVMPWITKSAYKNKLLLDFSLKKITSNLITRCTSKYNKIIAFTSTSKVKNKSSSLYDIATNIKQAGYSVVIVDADLAVPGMLKSAKVFNSINLSDILIEIDNKLNNSEPISKEQILKTLVKDNKGMTIIGNCRSVDSSYELLSKKSFKTLLYILKEHFDWVLIDAPPINVAPEFNLISRHTDGAVLFVDYQTTFSVLKRFMNIFKEQSVHLIGTIIREEDPSIEKDFKVSIKRQGLVQELKHNMKNSTGA